MCFGCRVGEGVDCTRGTAWGRAGKGLQHCLAFLSLSALLSLLQEFSFSAGCYFVCVVGMQRSDACTYHSINTCWINGSFFSGTNSSGQLTTVRFVSGDYTRGHELLLINLSLLNLPLTTFRNILGQNTWEFIVGTEILFGRNSIPQILSTLLIFGLENIVRVSLCEIKGVRTQPLKTSMVSALVELQIGSLILVLIPLWHRHHHAFIFHLSQWVWFLLLPHVCTSPFVYVFDV